MKKLILLFLLFPLALCASTSTAEDEINQFFEEISSALNNKDIAAVENSWNSEGELFTLAGGIYKGQSEIKTLFQESFSSPLYQNGRYSFFTQYIRFTDEAHAVVDGVWKTSNAGPPNYPSCGIFLYLLSKHENRWKINLAYSSVPGKGHTREHGRILSWVKTCQDEK